MTPHTRKHLPQITTKLSDDIYLEPFKDKIESRFQKALQKEKELCGSMSLKEFASGHLYFGLHFKNKKWTFRELAPNATKIYLIGDFSGWQEDETFALDSIDQDSGVWEIKLPEKALAHGMLYRLKIYWANGHGERLPAYVQRAVQDTTTHVFSAQVWKPKKKYQWQNKSPKADTPILIYEAHVGMSSSEEKVSSYKEFQDTVLPKIVNDGYNTLQLMAIMEHPYYGSFGYHVSNLFAASSRFGTPEELKALIDKAHGYGLKVIIDLVHSHAVKNDDEGLGNLDGTRHLYFHEGARGNHAAWDSYCFNYDKNAVLHFLLSNCRFWLEEYQLDGFRFDGITSMTYLHHGLNYSFTSYENYFNDQVDEDALVYLTLANQLIHQVSSSAITIAEDVSGYPGLATPVEQKGIGFDYRLAMGVTDYWFKLFDLKDEEWSMPELWHELTNRRQDEHVISYTESHDQAIVGGQTILFRLAGKDIYHSMDVSSKSLNIDRAIALHKLSRLATIACSNCGYLNFMGNEFGHPEWVDFPREGNQWSYHHARRLWHLAEDQQLRYHHLLNFDNKIIHLFNEDKDLIKKRIQKILINNSDKIMIFERNSFIFIFNFHPSNSYENYEFPLLPGTYQHILNSDETSYGGYNRIKPNQAFHTTHHQKDHETTHTLKVYIPARTALVLQKITPNVN